MRSYIIPFSGQKIHKIKKKYTQLLKPQRELGEKTHILKVLGFFFTLLVMLPNTLMKQLKTMC